MRTVTLEELKKHCIKMIQKGKRLGFPEDSLNIQKHKIFLQLIEEHEQRQSTGAVSGGWIPTDFDKYPETYPKPYQEVWETDSYGNVIHRMYGGERNIIAWMPYIGPKAYNKADMKEGGTNT